MILTNFQIVVKFEFIFPLIHIKLFDKCAYISINFEQSLVKCPMYVINFL